MSDRAAGPGVSHPRDAVGLRWLTRVRWATIAAGAGAALAGHAALGLSLPLRAIVAGMVGWIASNVWLVRRVARDDASPVTAGVLVIVDVVALTVVLSAAGGSLNPVSIFYLVPIVVAALVLGPRWTWVITATAAVGYASLYAMPDAALTAALGMHQEFGLHMRGMWLAFAATALIVAMLVSQLAGAVERRDRALDDLREQHLRASRAAALATLAAGAAHELGTPLSTIVVAARELENRLSDAAAPSRPDLVADLHDDVRLIRAEADRCRQVLDAMAVESGQPIGEAAAVHKLSVVASSVRDRLPPGRRARLEITILSDVAVVWPLHLVVRALANLVQNAFDASSPEGRVALDARVTGNVVELTITDEGVGMSAEQQRRVGEPFYTTKPDGTGLGIFVARSTVEQLGGQLAFAARQPQGTTVRVKLPVDVIHPHEADGA